MAKTQSTMLPLGSLAPEFTLSDVTSGKKISLRNQQESLATVIMFICNHCPYVKHINKVLAKIANQYKKNKIRFIAINSNDVENYPQDSPKNMQIMAAQEGYSFPYLFDETQEIARAYHAACTPDFFVFNKNLSLVYRGQFDDSRPGNQIETDGHSIRLALDCLIDNQAIPETQKPSLGCNIKWKN